MRKLLFLLFLITHASIYFQPAYASTLPTIPYVEFEIQVHTIEPILRAIENQKSLDSKLNLIYFYIRKYNKKQIIAEKE